MINLRGWPQKIVGAVLVGAGISGASYYGFEEGDWFKGAIICGGGYTFGTLFTKLGNEIWFEKRVEEFKKEISRKYDEKLREVEK